MGPGFAHAASSPRCPYAKYPPAIQPGCAELHCANNILNSQWLRLPVHYVPAGRLCSFQPALGTWAGGTFSIWNVVGQGARGREHRNWLLTLCSPSLDYYWSHGYAQPQGIDRYNFMCSQSPSYPWKLDYPSHLPRKAPWLLHLLWGCSNYLLHAPTNLAQAGSGSSLLQNPITLFLLLSTCTCLYSSHFYLLPLLVQSSIQNRLPNDWMVWEEPGGRDTNQVGSCQTGPDKLD
jgi:hypothetical protein